LNCGSLEGNIKVKQLLAVAVTQSREQDVRADQWLLDAAYVEE
jgi:hypothetical protein